MTLLSLLIRLGILAGVLIGVGVALMGLAFLLSGKVGKGLKHMLIGLALPCILVIGPLSLVGHFLYDGDANTDRITVKGRVVDTAGSPIEGARVNLTPSLTGCDSGELYRYYSCEEAVSDATGNYELAVTKPLSIQNTMYYLGSSNAAIRAQTFFFGQVTAEHSTYRGYAEPQITVPLISENRLRRARRALFVCRLFGWGRPERSDLCLPRSEGDVLFLPDITLTDEPVKPSAETETAAATLSRPAQSGTTAEHAVAQNRDAFKRRCEADKAAFGEPLFREIEMRYQSANRDLSSTNAVSILKSLIADYPLANRAGCAAQYLGQMTAGADQERYLQLAIRDFGDCFYGSGVQVGAYARLYLGRHYMAKGMTKEAKALFDEIRKDYPDAVNHQGQPLAGFLPR